MKILLTTEQVAVTRKKGEKETPAPKTWTAIGQRAIEAAGGSIVGTINDIMFTIIKYLAAFAFLIAVLFGLGAKVGFAIPGLQPIKALLLARKGKVLEAISTFLNRDKSKDSEINIKGVPPERTAMFLGKLDEKLGGLKELINNFVTEERLNNLSETDLMTAKTQIDGFKKTLSAGGAQEFTGFYEAEIRSLELQYKDLQTNLQKNQFSKSAQKIVEITRVLMSKESFRRSYSTTQIQEIAAVLYFKNDVGPIRQFFSNLSSMFSK
jgi:hypothetical protein